MKSASGTIAAPLRPLRWLPSATSRLKLTARRQREAGPGLRVSGHHAGAGQDPELPEGGLCPDFQERHLYMFTNATKLETIDPVKVKNE